MRVSVKPHDSDRTTFSKARAIADQAFSRAASTCRLLIPGGTDIPILKPLAKTAVTDGRWARVGSTNLNMASWLGNCELDAVVEDESFAREMEEMYLQDLANATEDFISWEK